MRTFCSRVLALSAVALLPWAAPAHAAELSAESVLMHLKAHPELPLAWNGERAELAAEGDAWTLTPIEALQDLGAYLIVHDETGQCLTAEPMPVGAETAPVALADCADAEPWALVYDDVPANQDYRFVTAEGHYLGVEDSDEAAAGDEVVIVDRDASRHGQEWRFAAVPDEETPSTPPPAEETTDAPAARPELPQTGAGVAAVGGVGLASVAAGAVMVLWWRRRTLPGQW